MSTTRRSDLIKPLEDEKEIVFNELRSYVGAGTQDVKDLRILLNNAIERYKLGSTNTHLAIALKLQAESKTQDRRVLVSSIYAYLKILVSKKSTTLAPLLANVLAKAVNLKNTTYAKLVERMELRESLLTRYRQLTAQIDDLKIPRQNEAKSIEPSTPVMSIPLQLINKHVNTRTELIALLQETVDKMLDRVNFLQNSLFQNSQPMSAPASTPALVSDQAAPLTQISEINTSSSFTEEELKAAESDDFDGLSDSTNWAQALSELEDEYQTTLETDPNFRVTKYFYNSQYANDNDSDTSSDYGINSLFKDPVENKVDAVDNSLRINPLLKEKLNKIGQSWEPIAETTYDEPEEQKLPAHSSVSTTGLVQQVLSAQPATTKLSERMQQLTAVFEPAGTTMPIKLLQIKNPAASYLNTATTPDAEPRSSFSKRI